ncbi:FAD-binding and (Fe-S)-binding domain-containing protein [Pelomonas sp. KK5]|uniref:FAD-binding and (Fe-S)-binding domain-containing protein n=1 Tax=Pelomonas sp. KK5 TaxID=1855730 RepID=UPI00117EBC40|nr:FAD-binding and (Fe-S)-binding domain-containing protein [Pelomonas sp. KK5]
MPETPDIIPELERRLRAQTAGEVHADAAGRGRYATDASIYQLMPACVLVPRSEDDVAAAIAVCRELQVAVVPRGAGTGEAGQALAAAPGNTLVIDCSRHLNRLLALDEQARTVTVQPGMTLAALNEQLRPRGLWLPLDIDSAFEATLGGMAGTDAAGPRALGYGSMAQQVQSISAWMADGELLDFGPVAGLPSGGRAAALAARLRALTGACAAELEQHWPRVSAGIGGYRLDLFDNRRPRPTAAGSHVGEANLAHLLVGAEGSLAFVRSLTLRLRPLPAARVLGLISLRTLAGVLELVPPLLAQFKPTAFELLEPAACTPGADPFTLLIELSGDDPAQLQTRLAEMAVLLRERNLPPGCIVRVTDEAQQQAVWARRRAALMARRRPAGPARPTSFIDGCAVPVPQLPAYVDALDKLLRRHGIDVEGWHGPVGLGQLHPRPRLDMRQHGSKGGTAVMRKLAEEVSVLVRRFRGSYGNGGLVGGEWLDWQFGSKLNEALRAVKNEFDPGFLFNPGKIVRPGKMDDPARLRFPPRGAPRPYKIMEIKPALAWAESGELPGLVQAVEACDGLATCTAAGVCPSEQALQSETHGVRGRANTLRLALSGQLDGGLGGPAVQEALATCTGCKACRSGCPSGVDIARLQLEAAAQRAAARPPTRREQLYASLPADVHSGLRAWLVRQRNRSPWLARLAEKHLQLSPRRALPEWRPAETFWRSAEGLDSLPATLAAAPKAAVLFVDTFNGAFEAANARAAVRVLKAAGYTLHSPAAPAKAGHLCCGRTALAVGQVALARSRLAALLAALAPAAQAGLPIVGLEPACLLMLREEAQALGLGDQAAQVASQALLFEEFIAREARAGRFALKLKPAEAPLLVHGHCHTRAAGAVAPILEVLRMIPGAEPALAEAACCGMGAGLGFEAEHEAASLQIAEQALLPALRARPEALVLADGCACRRQIAHGAQREALHVARLLERQLLS